jgi:hypothetical protein
MTQALKFAVIAFSEAAWMPGRVEPAETAVPAGAKGQRRSEALVMQGFDFPW